MQDKYAVIGNPIAHSLSPLIHHAFARETGENIGYTKIETSEVEFQTAVHAFREQGGKGLNITAPFKEAAFKLASSFSPAAFQTKAANVLTFNPDGTITADNTDGAGFIQDVTVNHLGSFKNKHILILGAGGAVRGLMGPLLAHNPTCITLVNRTWAKLNALMNDFTQTTSQTKACPMEACSILDLSKKQFDWVIDGASAQTELLSQLPMTLLAEGAWCYTLSYATQAHPFLRWAKQYGAEKVLDGLGLLVEQAALSFWIWRGIKPKTDAILKRLRLQFPEPV